MADSYPYGIFGQDPENITYGTDTKKAAEQLAKFRASLRASEDIVGGEPRLVSDTTPSGFPSSKYGAGDAFNQTLRDEDFNNAYLEGRKLGLSDRDAKMVARLKIGQDATQASTENTMLRQAINETEMTDLRRALTEQASESLDPYIGPDYRDQANFDFQEYQSGQERKISAINAILSNEAFMTEKKYATQRTKFFTMLDTFSSTISDIRDLGLVELAD